MRKILAIVLAAVLVLSLAACGEKVEPTKKPVQYPRLMGELERGPSQTNPDYIINELYVLDEIQNKKVYTLEIVPGGFNKESGEKLPVIIYAHGARGDAKSLISEPKELAKNGIAGFTFEACGANNGNAVMSDDGNPTSSSRASNMEAVYQYVKSLPWVDQNRIFIYGQSAGGSAVMHFAPQHPDEIAGMIIESAGIGVSTQNTPRELGESDIKEFFPASGQGLLDYYKQFNGDVIICNSELDGNNVEAGENAAAIFNERTKGTAKFYFCPGGAHTFNSYSDEGKEITLNAIRELVLGK